MTIYADMRLMISYNAIAALPTICWLGVYFETCYGTVCVSCATRCFATVRVVFSIGYRTSVEMYHLNDRGVPKVDKHSPWSTNTTSTRLPDLRDLTLMLEIFT